MLMSALDELFAGMRRAPGIEAPGLVAVDAADRLLLDLAGPALAAAAPGTLVVLDDHHGALTLGAALAYGATAIRVHQDLLTGERALANNAARAGLTDRYRSGELDAGLLRDAAVVVLRMPRGLAQLDELADAIARWAGSDVIVFAGGRDKHLTPAMNDVLARYFADVRPSRGRQKSRVIVASGPKPVAAPPFPVTAEPAELGLSVVAHGAAFAGPRLDIGTRFLLEHLSRMRPDAAVAVDLGCGTGILAAALARARPALRVLATDQSAAAVASARATMRVNGLAGRVAVLRDDAMGRIPDAGADLIVCNPPFHVGAAVHTGSAMTMFRAAGRVLAPGGELWTVYNGHLGHRGMLERLVGPTEVVGHNRKFIVARSVRLTSAGYPA